MLYYSIYEVLENSNGVIGHLRAFIILCSKFFKKMFLIIQEGITSWIGMNEKWKGLPKFCGAGTLLFHVLV